MFEGNTFHVRYLLQQILFVFNFNTNLTSILVIINFRQQCKLISLNK